MGRRRRDGGRRDGALGVALLTPLLVLFPTAGTAAAADGPGCGAQISTSTTLTTDLFCPGPGDGLVVTGDDVVLDLGTASVVGGGWSGIRVQGQGVTVRGGGLVTGWASGISVDEGASALVERVTARRNVTGISIDGDATLRTSQVRGNSVGVLVSGTGEVTLEHTDVVRNPVGVGAWEGGTVDVVESTVRSNQTGLDCGAGSRLRVDRALVVDAGTAVRTGDCGPGAVTVSQSVFLHNDVQVDDPSSSTGTYSCTTFLDGRNAPSVVPCGSR